MQITMTTVGRKSGLPRDVTLYAYEDDGRLVVVGSYGGAPRDPNWALNLRADPRVVVRRGRQQTEMTATEVDDAERVRLWAMVCDQFPLYATYQGRTTRLIPLFLLAPAGDSGIQGR
jgi:deazaflavin-dependent oxidoreductase (nitroreductase family)